MTALFAPEGYLDRADVLWHLGSLSEANDLLAQHHYLGPLRSGGKAVTVGSKCGEPVAAMIWKHPTSRRPPPGGHGDWGSGPQSIKDRWVYCVKPDPIRAGVLDVGDPGAVRHWQANATDVERRWAANSLNLRGVA